MAIEADLHTARLSYANGFTLIELVIVITLIGILSATILPRMNIDRFKEAEGMQQGVAMMHFGQNIALASGCKVQVKLDKNLCTLQFDDCSGEKIVDPANGKSNFCQYSTPGVISAVDFVFNGNGIPTLGKQTVLFSNGNTVIIEANTGFIHE